MAARAQAGAREGLWLRAERQNGGRGRLGRSWVSPVGNLYCSTIVRPGPADPPAQTLAYVTALAVHDAIVPLVAPGRLAIKWPNDLLLDGAKLAGVLLERSGDAVVVGVGVNVATAPQLPDRSAAALHSAGVDPRVDAALLIEELAHAFARRLLRWRSEGLAATLTEWEARALPPGTAMITTGACGARIEGCYAGLAPDGALRLSLADGRAIAVHAGDVELARPAR